MTIIEKDLERPLVYPTFLRFSILYKGDKTPYLANILANMLVLLPPWPPRTQPVVPLLRPNTQARLRRMVCRPVMVAARNHHPLLTRAYNGTDQFRRDGIWRRYTVTPDIGLLT
jgi:hypothetical protein